MCACVRACVSACVCVCERDGRVGWGGGGGASGFRLAAHTQDV